MIGTLSLNPLFANGRRDANTSSRLMSVGVFASIDVRHDRLGGARREREVRVVVEIRIEI